MKRKQVKHVRVSKLGKAFTAGSQQAKKMGAKALHATGKAIKYGAPVVGGIVMGAARAIGPMNTLKLGWALAHGKIKPKDWKLKTAALTGGKAAAGMFVATLTTEAAFSALNALAERRAREQWKARK